MQVLGLITLICAAACQTAIRNSNIFYRTENLVPDSETDAAAGWVIFLSFWVMLYQILAIVQLFLHVNILYKRIPYINWSIFLLVVR